jgi:hypothetical protein
MWLGIGIGGGAVAFILVLAVFFSLATGQLAPPPRHTGGVSGNTATGTQLGKLLTQAALPAGWEAVGGGGVQEDDSGGWVGTALGTDSANYGCSILPDADGLDLLWFDSSWAWYAIQGSQPVPAGAEIPIMTLTLSAFQPAANAVKNVSAASRLASSCQSFTSDLGSVRVTSAAVPGIGSQALYIQVTTQTSTGPEITQALMAQVGSYLVSVDTDTSTSSYISQATLKSMTSWLTGLLR